MADQTAVSGNKPAVEVVEDRMENRIDDGEVYKPAALAGDGLVKSPLDELPILKDLWLFRVSILYAFFAFTSSILDGFAVSKAQSIPVRGRQTNMTRFPCLARLSTMLGSRSNSACGTLTAPM